jgi:hypothetical protein
VADWSGPSEQLELQELSRETAAAQRLDRRWYPVAFLAGIALVCLLGFSTNLFDSGPSALEVSDAYRDAYDQSKAAAEIRWEEDLLSAWWEGYKRGQASDTSKAPELVEAMRDGFSFDSGFEAGLQSPEIDLEDRYREGWMEGYVEAFAQVAGALAEAAFDSNSDGAELARNGQ